MGFSQAVSGLNAASNNLDVIGNNIANSATAGFKSSTVAFADMFAGSKVGMGTKVAAVIQDFGDGIASTTNRALDVAIGGQGFYRMTDSAGAVYYSRNGQFTLDADRNVVNMQGQYLTGYPVAGNPLAVQTGAEPVKLTIPSTPMSAKATTKANLEIIPNSSDSVPQVTPFDAANVSSYNGKTSMSTYDSLGNEHKIDFYAVKTADNNWTIHTIDASTGNSSGDFNMTFNESGQLTSADSVTLDMASLNGSAAQTFTLSLTGSQQQNNGKTDFGAPAQDGYKPGSMTGYQINNDGTIVGNYSNDKTQVLGQIILSNFANPEGLKSEGDNLWSATSSSGQPTSGTAGSGNLGNLTSGALEASNVDLSKEMVNMIVAQRNYQSNAQTIKTQDQILNTLVNLR